MREEVLSNAQLTGLRDEDLRDHGIAEHRVLSSLKGKVHGVMRSEQSRTRLKQLSTQPPSS